MNPKWTVRLDRTIGRRIYPLHGWLYRVTGGRIGHRSPLGPVLLLTANGRKSGLPRISPLLYFADGDDYVVVASNGGRPQMPAWFHNVRANPEVEVQAGRRRFRAKAEVASPEERARLWPRLTEFYKGWAHYQTLTDREIPVVLLRPTG